jgi:hypothetical protein
MVVTKAGVVKATTAGTAVPMRSIAGDALDGRSAGLAKPKLRSSEGLVP